MPQSWSESLAGGETNGVAQVAKWWKSFSDPELDSLVDRAVKSNLRLRIAESRVREARAQRSIITAGLWPSIGVSGSYTRNRISKNYFIPLPAEAARDYNWYQAGFDASWEADLFGRTRRGIEAADADVAASEFNRRDVMVSLLAELARDYFEARAAQEQLAITQRNIAAQKNSLALTRERHRAGLTSELDVQQATALLADTEAQMPTLETTLKVAVHSLAILLAQPPGELRSEFSKAAPLPTPPPRVPVGLPSDLLLRRPDIGRAERELAAATARIGVAKADLFPSFSLTGNGGFQSVSVGEWFTPGSLFWNFGPTLTWRAFDAGKIRANIRVQNARQEQALDAYEETVLGAFGDVENALVSYAKEQQRAHSLQASVQAQRAALAIAQDLYKNGLADFLRVLESERSLYQAEASLIQSQNSVAQNLVALYKALGGGWKTR